MERDILTRIARSGAAFSKGQRRIADFVSKNYDKAAFMTAGKLGRAVGVSESTVVRFASDLGYDGYPEMRKALQEMIRSRLTSVQRIEVAREFGAHAVADIAARDGWVKVNGWRDDAALSADELIARLASLGFEHLVFTDVARDGMQTGIDTAAYAHIAAVAGFPVVASGGVASVADIAALAALGPDVIEGAICGRAIFEGSLKLEDALAAAGGEGAC